MNTSARNILSTISGLALVAYTAYAATTAGFASNSAVLGISGLTIWALVQMIMLELSSHSSATNRSMQTTVQSVRTPAMIAFPDAGVVARHAA